MKNLSRIGFFTLSLLLTASLGAGGQNFYGDDPAGRRRVFHVARQFKTATANFAQVLGRRVRGFSQLGRHADNLFRSAQHFAQNGSGRGGNGRGGRGNIGFQSVEREYYATRNAIHSGIRFPANQGSERSYYALINSWAQVVHSFDQLQEAYSINPGRPLRPNPGNDRFSKSYRVRCASEDYRRAECRLPGQIIRVDLLDQHSRARCTQGRTFGARGNRLWVAEGCVGDFQVTVR